MEIRARILRREPRCRICLDAGRLSVATEVDHVVPLEEEGSDEDQNLQGLCHDCHAEKTAAEQRARALRIA
jgi:5-methylcytosine-specific restriction protein A